MNLSDAHNVFAIRLYEWSQHDLLRELEADCPLLSLVGLNNRRVAAFVEWNKTLSTDQRLALSKSLTALCHENARRLKGETITETIERWKDIEYRQTSHYMGILPPLKTSDRTLPTFRPIDPDACLYCLSTFVSPAVLGEPSRRKSMVRCARKIGDWKLITDFTFERRAKNLCCTFQFVRRDNKSEVPPVENGPHPFPRSLFLFYGVYNRTVVGAESQADSEPMARGMVKLAEHFVAQADPLFAGLGIDG